MDEEEAVHAQPVASTSKLPSAAEAPETAGPSKSSLKKAARQARFESTKQHRRQAEKERKKARDAQRRQDLKDGKLSAEEIEAMQAKRKAKEIKKRGGKSHVTDEDCWQGGVIMDLGFDDLMLESEVKSMGSQLAYSYSINRMSTKPFRTILFTSFNARLRQRIELISTGSWERWPRTRFIENSLHDLVKQHRGHMDQEDVPFKGQDLVYLTADAEEELETLKESETYIIGGIVDRNRYKNLCRDKAQELGIRTARLPIGTYLAEMPTRKVLTVNQVFDILVKYNELKDWKAAFEAVMPARKFLATSKRKRTGSAETGGDDAEANDEDGDHTALDEEMEMAVLNGEIDEEAVLNLANGA